MKPQTSSHTRMPWVIGLLTVAIIVFGLTYSKGLVSCGETADCPTEVRIGYPQTYQYRTTDYHRIDTVELLQDIAMWLTPVTAVIFYKVYTKVK